MPGEIAIGQIEKVEFPIDWISGEKVKLAGIHVLTKAQKKILLVISVENIYSIVEKIPGNLKAKLEGLKGQKLILRR